MGRNADFDQVTIDTIVDGSSGTTHDPDDIGSGGGGGGTVVHTGTVTLTNGTGQDSTAIAVDTAASYDVRPVFSGGAVDPAFSLEYDGTTIIVHVEENTSSTNNSVGYELIEYV